MYIRNCAGGVVFCKHQVLLIQNDKGEWAFPKGLVREGESPDDVAVWRVMDETAVSARIISVAGRTNYEFFSQTRKRPVANRILWYIMICDFPEATPSLKQSVLQASFFPFEEALKKVTYSQDKSLLMLARQKYRDVIGEDDEA